ncbi:uncharacterized protein ACRADG_002585 [Cochliomyia hominivorax]
MKSLVIFVAVLLSAQAAKVPQEVTHQVSVTVPTNVLAAASPLVPTKTETPSSLSDVHAHVVEVTKTQKPPTQTTTVIPQVTMKEKLETITETSSVVTPKMTRKMRAAPFMDDDKVRPQLTTDVNKIKQILTQKKRNMSNNMMQQRVKRSLSLETKAVTAAGTSEMSSTQNPVITPVDSPKTTIDPCDLLCTKFEFDPICATNGLCLHEFPNQCILETYNCKHKQKTFSATKDDRCQMHWLTKCDESEMI